MIYGIRVFMDALRRGIGNGGVWALTRLVFLCSVMSVGMNVSAHAHNVAFRLFDGGFQPVAEQYIGPRSAGTHTETLAFPGLSSGTYYLNLVLDGEEQEDLLLIVKL